MEFLSLPPFQKKQRSQDQMLVHSEFYAEPSCRMLLVPVQGTMDVRDGYSPLVRFAGTFWRFKPYGLCPASFFNGQTVRILGRQGNRLLIELERCDER